MNALRQLAGFLRPYALPVVIGPLFMLLEVAMDLAQPRLLQHIVDVGIARLDMDVILRTGLLMVGLALVGVVGGVLNTVLAVRVAQGFAADVRDALFRQVQALSFGNLDRLGTGPLITRLTSDVTQVQEVVLVLLRILVRAPLMLIGAIIMAFVTSPRLALLLLVLGPIVVWILVWVIRRAHPLFSEVQARLDRLNTVMQENLSGVRLVKAFVRADHEIERFGASNDSLMEQTITATRLVAGVPALMMLTLNFGVVAVLWLGGVQVTRGGLQVGQIIAFINYLLMTLFSLMMVGMLMVRVSRAEASAERIEEVLGNEPEIEDRPQALATLDPRGRVAFENVGFSYNGHASEPVLHDVSFVAEPGETIAILGATGSGKSSLVHLIPRFYEVSSGRVTLDGVDVRDISQAALHRHIAVALQESVLFSGTVRDNIRYGRPEASDDEVIAAARAAQAHDFIVQLPGGYDAVLGQRGVNLSGGQKQRLAIARALITRPAVLILDDSTSSVDVETEAHLQEALARFTAGCTRFIIAQRVSTVLTADKILVLDEGALVAEGTHAELLASSPVYREIYDSQLGNGVTARG